MSSSFSIFFWFSKGIVPKNLGLFGICLTECHIFPVQNPVGCPHCTHLSAHRAGMPFLRRTAFKIIPCLFRVNRTRKHAFPVDSLSGFAHPVVLFSCIWDSVRNICRMGSNFRCYDALPNVLQIRQPQMFRWCDIAQEVCTAGCGNCSTDGGSNMVIARCNIGYQRP